MSRRTIALVLVTIFGLLLSSCGGAAATPAPESDANLRLAAIFPGVITDADYNGARELYLRHEHDGRDLDLKHAEKTLAYLHQLWGRRTHLETRIEGKPTLLTYDEDGCRRNNKI
jgi:hypothetical protein